MLRSYLVMITGALCLSFLIGCSSSPGGSSSGDNNADEVNNTTLADTGGGDNSNSATAPDVSGDNNATDGGDDTSMEDVALEDAPGNDAADVSEDTRADGSMGDTPDDVSAIYLGTSDPYAVGPLTVVESDVEGAPVPLRVYAPGAGADVGASSYPVVIFQHGFILQNTYYSALLTHLASHGFVVLAPQMYANDGLPFGKPTAAAEAETASSLLDWAQTGLAGSLEVPISFDEVGYAGHSRGGKVIWLLLEAGAAVPVAAWAGLDPVDGMGGPGGMEARAIAGASSFEGPTAMIGTGLGPVDGGPFAPPCAPTDDNHITFYANTASPSWHVTLTTAGHNDFLDDNPPGCFACGACMAGPEKAGPRAVTAGVLVSLFRDALQGDTAATSNIDAAGDHGVDVTLESK